MADKALVPFQVLTLHIIFVIVNHSLQEYLKDSCPF